MLRLAVLVAVDPERAGTVFVIHLHLEAWIAAFLAIKVGGKLAADVFRTRGVLGRADMEDAGKLREVVTHAGPPDMKGPA